VELLYISPQLTKLQPAILQLTFLAHSVYVCVCVCEQSPWVITWTWNGRGRARNLSIASSKPLRHGTQMRK